MHPELRKDFPLLQGRRENGKPLAYLDNAATTQKPQAVLDAVTHYYEHANASPHRGAYTLSAEATAIYEGARARAAAFIGAGSAEEIVFTKSTTEALNMVAQGYAEPMLEPGDEILLSVAEHHANLLPWQRAAQRTGARLVYVAPAADGRLHLEDVRAALSARTRIVALGHISNVLGRQNPLAEIAQLAHARGAVVVVDAAQSAPHVPVDVQALGADFLAFSGHKLLAPGGIGVLYARAELQARMQPLLLGGGIVEEVTLEGVRLLEGPQRFEAGTQNVEAAAGLTAALDYIEGVGFAKIEATEHALVHAMLQGLRALPEVQIYGGEDDEGRCGIVSFNIEGVHPHDVASILDAAGVAIRAGHHCAQPLMRHLGIHSCCRASVYLYNNEEDIARFVEAIRGVRGWLGLGPA